MAAFIGHPERGRGSGVRESVAEFLEEELCHHRVSMEDLAADRQISFAAKSLYLTLRGMLRGIRRTSRSKRPRRLRKPWT